MAIIPIGDTKLEGYIISYVGTVGGGGKEAVSILGMISDSPLALQG